MNVSVKNLYKKYPRKNVLNGISVSFCEGKIHALLGENGAGKSTLASILSGNLSPTEGTIFLDDVQTEIKNVRDALNHKIVMVHQRPLLAENLTVKENILLSLSEVKQKKQSVSAFTELSKNLLQQNVCDINPNMYIKDAGGEIRFFTSFMEALLREPKVLILDEPCAFLDSNQRKNFYAYLKNLAGQNCNIIVITHSYAEAKNYCNDVTYLQDGTVLEKSLDSILSQNKAPVNLNNANGKTGDNKISMLTIKDLTLRPKDKAPLFNINFSCPKGLITAVTGEKEAALSTLEDYVTERRFLRRTVKKIAPQEKNWRSLLGIIPSDRTFRGTNPVLTIEEMLGIYSRKKDSLNTTNEIIKRAKVNILPNEKVSALSGGMMQRLILERELYHNPSFVIMCNPMQGLDIKSQGLLAQRISQLSSSGVTVLILGAEDFPLTLCHKVYQMEGGTLELSFSK